MAEDGFRAARTSVSCVAAPTRLCLFGTADGVVYRTSDGIIWLSTDLHQRDVLPNTDAPLLTCATSRFCMGALGPYVWTWNGSGWSAPQRVLGADGRADGSFADLSCPTTAFCYGVVGGAPATAIRWQKGSWEPSRQILPSGSFENVDCSSAAYCLARGNFGTGSGYLVYTGLAWSPPQPGPVFEPFLIRPSLQCLSPTTCIRDTPTGVETYNGSARPAPTGSNDDAVSCWAAYTCLVVQSKGSYVTGRGSP